MKGTASVFGRGPVVGALVLLAVAGGVLADPPKADKAESRTELRGEFEAPLGSGRSDASGSHTMIYLSRSDGDNTISVKIEGDEISAEVNGKEIDRDRIDYDGKRVRIRDEDGNVIAEFDVQNQIGGLGEGGFGLNLGNRRMELHGQPGPRGMMRFGQVEPDHPKVMIGITMAEPDESLLEQLDIDPGEAILVTKVYDGLPADKAGLKPNDIIVGIEDHKEASPELLRDVLGDKEPGDELHLAVVRKGKRRDVTIDLVAFDAGALGVASPGADDDGGRFFSSPGEFEWRFDAQGMEGARKAINEALKQLKRLDPDALKAEAADALERAMKALKEAKEQFADRFQVPDLNRWLKPDSELLRGLRRDLKMHTPGPEGRGDRGRAPAMVFRDPDEGRLGELDRRIDRLSDRISRVDDRLERIQDLLERMSDDR